MHVLKELRTLWQRFSSRSAGETHLPSRRTRYLWLPPPPSIQASQVPVGVGFLPRFSRRRLWLNRTFLRPPSLSLRSQKSGSLIFQSLRRNSKLPGWPVKGSTLKHGATSVI
uniref:Uncharacterized protein n=1 Tax=Cacopsylla melanoneura TaxID=428564 RepID=A0A8D8VZL6_9HEMI